MQAEASAGGNKHLAIVERIGQLRQAGVATRRGGVELGGALHLEGLVWPFGIELADEGIEAFLLLQAIGARRPGGFPFEGEVHALMASVLLRVARLDAFDRNTKPEPPHRELGEVEQGVWTGEGHAVVGANGERQATLAEQPFEGGDCRLFAGGIERLAQQQEARGMVGDGQWIAVAPIAELELALEVSAPQIIGPSARGQRRAARAMARHAATLDQTVTVENRMDGAFGGKPDIAIEPPDQQFADLARAPVRLLGLQADNQALDLFRQLIGIAHRSPGTIAQGSQSLLPVAIENLVAGLTRYPELPADVRHGLPVQQAGDKAKAFFHNRTRFPRHPHLPQNKSGKCNPCVRYVLSPMSRAAQPWRASGGGPPGGRQGVGCLPKLRRSVGRLWPRVVRLLPRTEQWRHLCRIDGRSAT